MDGPFVFTVSTLFSINCCVNRQCIVKMNHLTHFSWNGRPEIIPQLEEWVSLSIYNYPWPKLAQPLIWVYTSQRMMGTFNWHMPMILFNNYWYQSKPTSLHDTGMGKSVHCWLSSGCVKWPESWVVTCKNCHDVLYKQGLDSLVSPRFVKCIFRKVGRNLFCEV